MADFGFDETQANITNDFDDVNAFDDDNEGGDVKQKDTLVRIGEYRFNLEREEYLALIKDIQLRYGFTKDEIIKGLKDRLCS